MHKYKVSGKGAAMAVRMAHLSVLESLPDGSVVVEVLDLDKLTEITDRFRDVEVDPLI